MSELIKLRFKQQPKIIPVCLFCGTSKYEVTTIVSFGKISVTIKCDKCGCESILVNNLGTY